jgi:hypothetical protein
MGKTLETKEEIKDKNKVREGKKLQREIQRTC